TTQFQSPPKRLFRLSGIPLRDPAVEIEKTDEPDLRLLAGLRCGPRFRKICFAKQPDLFRGTWFATVLRRPLDFPNELSLLVGRDGVCQSHGRLWHFRFHEPYRCGEEEREERRLKASQSVSHAMFRVRCPEKYGLLGNTRENFG